MKIFKRIMIGILVLFGLIIISAIVIFQKKSFGKRPEGERLERLKRSPNYKNGEFVNLSETPTKADNATYLQILKSYFFNKAQTEPDIIIPSIKNDLKITPSSKPEITWFGHSSLFIQIEGKNILIDPVFSERPSPVSFAGSKSYKGTSVYSVEDFPEIDYVFLTHDHYDHLDYPTIDKLKDKVKKFYCPLGVGSHLEFWRVNPANIIELDWWDKAKITSDVELISTPARHFSGRGIVGRNSTLWTSFVLVTPNHKIFIGGDSGYDKHFKEIGEKYGPFDIAFLESGQYNSYWPYIHMMPEQTAQAAIDLKTKILLPVHWAKFTLALHPWNEPIQRVVKKAGELNVKLTTPMIGEKVVLDSLYPSKQWWVR